MCGFSGFVHLKPLSIDMHETCLKMGEAISHRGPDAGSVWISEARQVGLSHRRLSIQDVSSHGDQPMKRDNLVLIFNGEIYNHLEMRKDLARSGCLVDWKGHSDTETLLQGFLVWGVEKTLQRAIGMFAFALWNNEKSTVTLGRDRFGEKPLYYGCHGDVFLFGSDLRALQQHPIFVPQIDRSTLPIYLKRHYIPAPYSIFEGISKLPSGTTLELSTAEMRHPQGKEPQPYWTLNNLVRDAKANQFTGTYQEAKEAVEASISKAISRQMLSDVPLGAFLSGGIDSSTIVALMQKQSSRKVKTFTIGSDDASFDESSIARQTAAHLGTEHTEMIVSQKDVIDLIPTMPFFYSEPFSDASQLPTYIVSQLAKEKVTVALSGDGGDEMFGGYTRYLAGAKAWNINRKFPGTLRRAASRYIQTKNSTQWDNIFSALSPIVPSSFRNRKPGDGIIKFSNAMKADSEYEFYESLVNRIQTPESFLSVQGVSTADTLSGIWDSVEDIEMSLIERMMFCDAMSFMTDDVLVKVDRAAMANSLETRVPFLDHELVHLAWSLPQEMKIQDGVGKRILRDIVYDYVPKTVLDQPKSGFGLPVGKWLRAELRDWVEDLLDERSVESEGIFNSKAVSECWKRHIREESDMQHVLWPILMFRAWSKDTKCPLAN